MAMETLRLALGLASLWGLAVALELGSGLADVSDLGWG